jgi:hypothetical protein
MVQGSFGQCLKFNGLGKPREHVAAIAQLNNVHQDCVLGYRCCISLHVHCPDVSMRLERHSSICISINGLALLTGTQTQRILKGDSI